MSSNSDTCYKNWIMSKDLTPDTELQINLWACVDPEKYT